MDYNRYMDAFPHMREMMIWHTPYYPPFFLYLVYYVLPWIILTALSSFTFLRLSTRQKETPEHLSTNQNITERISIYVALVSILMLIYSVNFRVGSTPGDTFGARYLPFSIIKNGNFNLDQFPFLQNSNYYTRQENNHWVSKYPPGAPILALPIYLFPVMLGLPVDSPHVPCLEKMTASLATALSALFLFLTAKIFLSRNGAFLLALIYGTATCSWSISSSSLWQHGPCQFFLALTLYLLTKGSGFQQPNNATSKKDNPQHQRWIKWSGLTVASAVVCRPTALVFALILLIYVWHKHRHQLPQFILMTIPAIIILAVYNHTAYGSILQQSYGNEVKMWGTPFYIGAFGVWFSPSRGLLILSPIFLFSLWGIRKIWGRFVSGSFLLIPGLYLGFLLICQNFDFRQHLISQDKGFLTSHTAYILFILFICTGIWNIYQSVRSLWKDTEKKHPRETPHLMLFQYCAICALLYPFLFSKWHMWYGGWSFGYRIMTEVSVFLCFVMIPIIPVITRQKFKMALFVSMILISCVIQSIGAFSYNNDWNGRNGVHDDVHGNQHNLWSWHDNQITFYIKHSILQR